MIAGGFTVKVLTAVADAAERVGGSFIERLGDGRVITVLVVREDEEEVGSS